jgi:ribosomal 50S subunit-recycling heat shock protein
MRLDKFLKISLLFKTRSSGEKAIEEKNVLLNGKETKPSHNIKIGDKITIKNSIAEREFEILLLLEKNVSREKAKEMVKLLHEKKNEL